MRNNALTLRVVGLVRIVLLLALGVGASSTIARADAIDSSRELRAQGKTREAIEVLVAGGIDAATRCELGLIYAEQRQLPEAYAFLNACTAPRPPTTRSDVDLKLRSSQRELRNGEFAPVVVSVNLERAQISLSGFAAGAEFSAPVSLWLPRGTFTVRATGPSQQSREVELVVSDRSRRALLIELTPVARPKPMGGVTNVIIEEEVSQPGIVGAPKKIRHKSLLREKWTRNRLRHRQERQESRRVEGRFVVGPALAGHRGDVARSRAPILGLYAGAGFAVRVSSWIAMESGLALLVAGEDGGSSGTSHTVSIGLPLLAKLSRKRDQRPRWRIEPAVGVTASLAVAGSLSGRSIQAFDLAPTAELCGLWRDWELSLRAQVGIMDIEAGAGTSRQWLLSSALGFRF